MSCSGVIRTWKITRGFGFITPDDGTEDIFVHVKNLVNGHERGGRSYLNIGEKVTYDVFTDDRTRKERASKCKGDGSGATPYEEEDDIGHRGGYEGARNNQRFRGPYRDTDRRSRGRYNRRERSGRKRYASRDRYASRRSYSRSYSRSHSPQRRRDYSHSSERD